jgi:hypothetical protein
MTITVMSRHLPAIWRHVGHPAGDSLLELLHLVESVRYHVDRLQSLTHGEGKAPSHFQPGIDVRGDELNEHWRFMAAWIELESIFLRGKQFLDRAWRCLGERVGRGAQDIATLPAAINKLPAKVKAKDVVEIVRQSPYFIALVEAWNDWGRELAGVRNYIEHHAAFGGLTVAHGGTMANGQRIALLYLPDQSPQWMDNPPKRTFTYNTRRPALDYARDRMRDIDRLVVRLMSVDEPLLYLDA